MSELAAFGMLGVFGLAAALLWATGLFFLFKPVIDEQEKCRRRQHREFKRQSKEMRAYRAMEKP